MRNNYTKLFLFFAFLSIYGRGLIAQNVLSFNGNSDYVVLDSAAGNGARTIEFWVSPAQTIDQNLSDFMSLVVREVSPTNELDWDIHFVPRGLALRAGTIRFTIHQTIGVRYEVLTDTNVWNANQWYHIAAVVDSIQGMMIFVDGKKQSQTLPTYTQATTSSSVSPMLGKWGAPANRFFRGRMDDVRISSKSIYLSNFTPPCPDLKATNSTIGLWNFNSNSIAVAIDSSLNHYNAQIFGAVKDTSSICQKITTTLDKLNSQNDISIYPNPSTDRFNFVIKGNISFQATIKIFDMKGLLIVEQTIDKKNFNIDLSPYSEGLYFYNLNLPNRLISGKLLKQ